MQLQRWRTVNRRLFTARSGPSAAEWRKLIRTGAINGKILGDEPYVDIDALAANTEFSEQPQSLRNDMPDLLG